MKKIIYLILFAGLYLQLQAQTVLSYEFQSQNKTFSYLTNETIVGASITGEDIQNIAFTDVSTSINTLTTVNGFAIGFDFIFNDQVMTRFAIGSNLFIALGESQISLNPSNSSAILTSDDMGKQNIIGCPINSDYRVGDDTQISYELSGIQPNRVLTVEYKDIEYSNQYWGFGTEVLKPSLQIKLYETSNDIEFLFNNWTRTDSGANKFCKVGIKGDSMDNMHCRASDWVNSTKDVANMPWNATSAPNDGLSYMFSTPNLCEVPSESVTNLVVQALSNSINGQFDKIDNADHYLVMCSMETTLDSLPVDTHLYSVNDTLGNAFVVAYGVDSLYETSIPLVSSTHYSIFVFSVNAFCSQGPRYNRQNFAMQSIKTLPACPIDFTTVCVDYGKIELNVGKVTTNDQVIIAQSFESGTDHLGNTLIDGRFGQVNALNSVGDTLKGGGEIIYIGDADTTIVLNQLPDNQLYHFAVWTLDENQQCSSTRLCSNDLTWGKVPFVADFTGQSTYHTPVGYTFLGEDIRLSLQRDTRVPLFEMDVRSPDITNGTINAVTTPWIQMAANTNRVLVNYNCHVLGNWGRPGTPLNQWNDRDTLYFQVSTNGVDFETFYSLQNDNLPQLAEEHDYAPLRAELANYNSQKVKLRILWNTTKKGVLSLENLRIEAIKDCDYPFALSVNHIDGRQVEIHCEKHNESLWEMRYKIVGSDSWSSNIELNSMPYTYANFPTGQFIEVQLRSICSINSYSDWSESYIFESGYDLPFEEDFTQGEQPIGWRFSHGQLEADTTIFDDNRAMIEVVNDGHIACDYRYNTQEWAILPILEFPSNVHYQLEFDLSLTDGDPANPTPDNQAFNVVLSSEEGSNFVESNKIFTLSGLNHGFDTIGTNTHYTVDLSAYSGKFRVAFYLESDAPDGSLITIDNVAINPTCIGASQVGVDAITETSATVNWQGTANEWLYYIREIGQAQPTYQVIQGNSIALNNLQATTNYEFGITKSCSVNDTAKLETVHFSTISVAPCEVVTNIVCTPTQTEARIEWQGEASSYNLRIRTVGGQWVEKTTSELFYLFVGLSPETSYEYAIQAVCGPNNMSDWSNTQIFTTQAVTCFVPTQLSVLPTHKTCRIAWQGNASQYTINYREKTDGSNEWTSSLVSDTVTILNNLLEETIYEFKVRGECSEYDHSEWTKVLEFTTLAIPECVVPYHLESEVIGTSSARLSWEADALNIRWNVHYRRGTETMWTTKENLTEKECQIDDLELDVVYLWAVKAFCEESESAWSAQETFSLPLGLETLDLSTFEVFAKEGNLNIINPSHCMIHSIVIYDMQGRVVQQYQVNTDDHIFIPTSLTNGHYLVVLTTGSHKMNYKIYL